jgi:hypothetical protein
VELDHRLEGLVLTLDLRFRQGTQADCTQRRLLAFVSWACGLSWSSLLEGVVAPRAMVDDTRGVKRQSA